MTSLYRSQEIDYVKMTLKAREDASEKILWLSNRFYAPESIFGFKAGYLDGNDYWSRADNAALSTGNIDFSLSAWVKVDAVSGTQTIVGKGNFASPNQTEYRLYIASTGELSLTIETGAATQTFSTTETLSADRWYFVAFWHDATNNIVGLSIDGRDVTASYSAGSFDSSGPFTIGKAPNDTSDYLTGYICNVGFWKKVLTEDERKQLYNLGTGLNYDELSGSLLTSLTAWWNCDDGASTISDNASTNDLTVTGGTATGNGPGNQPIYPALLSLPQVGFALGPVAAEQIDTQLVINAFLSLGNNSETFASLLKSYEVSGQTLQIYYVSNAPDEYLMLDADFPSLRQTLEMQSYDLNEDDGTITIACHDRWIKDAEIGAEATIEDFPNMPTADYGKPQPFVWGQRSSDTDGYTDRYGPFVPAVWVDIETDNPNSGETYAKSKLLYAATPNDFDIYSFEDDFIYNKDDPGIGAEPWHKVTWTNYGSAPEASPAIDGPSNATLTSTSNALSLVTYPVIARAWSKTTAYVTSGFRIELRDLNNSIVDADGPIRVSLHHAEIRDTNNLFLLNELRTKLITGGDARISGTAAVLTEIWDEPCVLLPNITYALCVRWLRDDAAGGTDIMEMFYSNSGSDVLYVESFGNDQFLTKAVSAVGLQMAIDGIYQISGGSDTGGASQEYASRNLYANYSSANSGAVKFESLTIRSYVKGYKDFTPKVHTATDGNIVKFPSEIISSILNAPSVCKLEDAGRFNHNVTTVTDAYEVHVGEQAKANLVLTAPTSAMESVLQIAELSRIRFIKERNGKLSARFTSNFNEYACEVISEALERSNMTLISLSETDPNQIVNDLKALYRREYLDNTKDPASVAKIGSDQYAAAFVLNKTSSTDADTTRQAMLEESVSLYGQKEWRREVALFDFREPVRKLVNYFSDRYCFKQKRGTFRLLKRDYHALFLRDHVQAQHTKLSGSDDYSANYVRDWDRLKVVDEDYAGVTFTGGAAVTVYSSGVPQSLLALGSLNGEVVALQEQGPFLYVTIENMAAFLEIDFTEGDYD